MKIFVLLCCLVAAVSAHAQLLRTEPSFITETSNSITIFADATKGNKRPQVPGHWGDDSARHEWCDRAAAWDIGQLEAQGVELARLWAGILIAAATKAAVKLADPRCKPKDFMQALAVIDRVAPYLTPDALKHIQPPAGGDGAARPEPTRESVR